MREEQANDVWISITGLFASAVSFASALDGSLETTRPTNILE